MASSPRGASSLRGGSSVGSFPWLAKKALTRLSRGNDALETMKSSATARALREGEEHSIRVERLQSNAANRIHECPITTETTLRY